MKDSIYKNQINFQFIIKFKVSSIIYQSFKSFQAQTLAYQQLAEVDFVGEK
jgi:hypothetical protein